MEPGAVHYCPFNTSDRRRARSLVKASYARSSYQGASLLLGPQRDVLQTPSHGVMCFRSKYACHDSTQALARSSAVHVSPSDSITKSYETLTPGLTFTLLR